MQNEFMLKELSVGVQTAQNGQEALDLVRSSAKFDFILMDLDMPIMNGWQSC
jgi:CheY-like chemotaxis protein